MRGRGREEDSEGWDEREREKAVRKSNPGKRVERADHCQPKDKVKHSRRPIVRNTQVLVNCSEKTRVCAGMCVTVIS